MKRIKAGLIGCGMISEIYLKNLLIVFNEVIEVCVCGDLNPLAAQKRAEEFGLKAADPEQIFQMKDLEMIINLTPPSAHYEIAKKTLMAGKHAYSEKPLALSLEEGKKIIDLAKGKGLMAAAAPDTFLGAGLSTCRRLLDKGLIGTPVFAQGIMLSRGPECFHPNPQFLYQSGGGPLFDMGPYYLTALTALFGPVAAVAAMTGKTYEKRKFQAPASPRYGETFPVEIDTLISGIMKFEMGLTAHVTMSWDMDNPYWKVGVPLLEVFGTKGALILPDPNTFCGICDGPYADPGKMVLYRDSSGETHEIPVEGEFLENSRGLGAADMAWHLLHGGTPGVNGDLSLHVLDIMSGFLESQKTQQFYTVLTHCERPDMVSQWPFTGRKEGMK